MTIVVIMGYTMISLFQWMRWNLDDSSRVVMPFANDNDETFPCGIAINLNSTLVITEGKLCSSNRSFEKD